MDHPGFEVEHLYDIPPLHEDTLPSEWKPIRRHLGIDAFGINAWVSRAAGQQVIEDHDESGIGHQELYFVVSGHADFEVDGHRVDARAGTFVFVRDPTLRRSAVAREANTAVIAIGGWPGKPFAPSEWEQRRAESADG